MFPVLQKKPQPPAPNEQTKDRERQWDERFVVGGGIPEYSPLKDKHAKSYKKMLQKKEQDELVSYRNAESVTNNNKKSWSRKKHDAINERLDIGNVQNNVRINALIKDLEKVWINERIPDFYSYYFMEQAKNVSPDRLEDLITKEIRSIRNKDNYYVDIVKTIEAREACLIEIRRVLENLKALKRNKDEEGFDNKLRTLQDEISHLRKLTLFTIDKVKKWREWLCSVDPSYASPQPPVFVFLYADENYLLRMLNDTNFLHTSLLSDHLVMASKNDPFILRPLKEPRTAANSKYMLLVECEEELRRRMMKGLEYLATEKAEELRGKIGGPGAVQREAAAVERAYNHKMDQQAKERKAKAMLDVNYETDVEKVEQFRQLEREKERLERLEKNQQRINAIKSIYEPKHPKTWGTDSKLPREPETDNQMVNNRHNNASMPKLKPPPADRSKSILFSRSTKKLPKKDSESEFESMLRNKQMQVLKEARAPQKLKDKLTTRKVMEDKEGMKELEKIVVSYNETKLINSVKGMDADIKGKIQRIKEEDENQSVVAAAVAKRPPVSVAALKQNDELIRELKNEIMSKLEREAADKERLKRMQREEESRLLEDMKVKLRREFEERIASEKAKRQAERAELEKQLQEEDIKLQEQKRLELELLTKMNHERDMREVERIKNETQAREKQLKKMLKDEQAKRSKIEASAKQEKLKYLEQLNKKALKDTLETELKQEMRDKMAREAQQEAKLQADKFTENNKKEIQKEIEILRIKEAMELQELRKSNEMRDKLLREKFLEEQRKSVELEELMKERMAAEKMEMELFAQEKRKEMENKLKSGAQEQLLHELKAGKVLQYDKQKRAKEHQIQQEVYRDKMRQKLERQMRLDVIKRTKEELEMRELKKAAITEQLERAQAKLEQQVINRPIDRAKIQSEVRKEVIEKAIIDKKMEKQIAKQQLRNQFEKELLSSGIPQIYTQKHDFLIKDLNAYKDDNYLKGKLEQQKLDVTQQAPQQRLHSYSQPPEQPSNLLSPTKRSQSPVMQQLQSRMNTEPRSLLNDSQLTNERTRLGMTEEQYSIYMKKRKPMESMRDDRDRTVVRPIEEMEEEEDYRRVIVGGTKKKRDKQEDTKIKPKGRKNLELEESDEEDQKKNRKHEEKSRKKKLTKDETDSDEAEVIRGKKANKKDEQDSDDSGYKQIKVKKKADSQQEESTKKAIKKKPKDDSDSEQDKKKASKKKKEDSQQEVKDKKNTTKKSKKKKQESQEEQQEEKPKRSASKKKTQQKSPTRKNNRSFETSDSQIIPKKVETKEKKNSRKNKQSESQEEQSEDKLVYFDKEEESAEQTRKRHVRTPSLRSRISAKNATVQNILQKTNEPFSIRVEALPEGQLDEYLGAHFIQLPKDQLQVQTQSRQDLYKKLMNEVTFSLLVGSEQGKPAGICIAYHDRNKEQSRKFVITHIGTYKSNHLFDFCISMCQYIFRKDPSDQVEFSFRYDESKEEQLEFSNDFNSKFDRYGAIFQKKIDDEKYERKYVMKRPFNLKCEVQIGAKSKHTFVNLFSINTSLLVSNMELVVNKEENLLSQTLAPEREISYSIMISEIFRNCLSPQQAETLKNKVKQYLKLKELLVLIVMLEKKKVKLEELKLNQFSTMTELNMKLMSQGKDLIRIVKDSGVSHNRIFFCELNQAFRLPFHFQTTYLPLQDNKAVHHINYFRMSAIPPHKLYTIKSSLYNSQMHVIPTQNPKFKLFLMSASEYNEIKDPNNLDLFTYVRVFLKNVKSHNVANWKYVWVPEMATRGHWSIRQYRSFLEKDIYALDMINISYTQFIPGSLMIQPEHKDLVITPPFVVGILSVTLEQVSQGSPLYVRLLEGDSLKIVESEAK